MHVEMIGDYVFQYKRMRDIVRGEHFWLDREDVMDNGTVGYLKLIGNKNAIRASTYNVSGIDVHSKSITGMSISEKFEEEGEVLVLLAEVEGVGYDEFINKIKKELNNG